MGRDGARPDAHPVECREAQRGVRPARDGVAGPLDDFANKVCAGHVFKEPAGGDDVTAILGRKGSGRAEVAQDGVGLHVAEHAKGPDAEAEVDARVVETVCPRARGRRAVEQVVTLLERGIELGTLAATWKGAKGPSSLPG